MSVFDQMSGPDPLPAAEVGIRISLSCQRPDKSGCRYLRFLKELPKTETQRVIKLVLEQEKVTADTVDLEPGGKKSG